MFSAVNCWLRLGAASLLGVVAIAAANAPASAASLHVLHRFSDTGAGTPSNYRLGASPQAELLQASDGNFYGTTINGGTGACPDPFGSGKIIGCGTIFRMAPSGAVTLLYAFPYDTASGSAANGAYPTAGLIQGKDGNLYGVARNGGGLGRCNAALGCGTLFRISLQGTFTLLHRFCTGDGCSNPTEGGQPAAHLVQLANSALCGITVEGGSGNNGTVFCSSLTGGVTTRYVFNPSNGIDGDCPLAALLAGSDGETLYGTTPFGGAGGQGTVFVLSGSTMKVLHAFSTSSADMTINPESALIFGANGKLYGTTYSGNPAAGIFSLETDGTGFASDNVFNSQTAGQGFESVSGLLLSADGLMYGTTYAGGSGGDNGSVYSYNPSKKIYKTLASFNGTTGAGPRAVLIEGSEKYLYGTATLYGGSNNLGSDAGTLVRLLPALPK